MWITHLVFMCGRHGIFKGSIVSRSRMCWKTVIIGPDWTRQLSVDVQPTGPDNYGNIIGAPDIYSIPFRCLVPLEVDQLLVAGRSASYNSLPHGSARVIPWVW